MLSVKQKCSLERDWSMSNSLFQAFRRDRGDPPRDARKKRAKGWGREKCVIFPAHSTNKKANYWESNKGRPAETINTKVRGKVNWIIYKLNLFPIFLVDKVKKNKKTEKLSFVGSWRVFLLSQRPVSRNANSASICKFKSNPSILNRVVPQVLLHKLTK